MLETLMTRRYAACTTMPLLVKAGQENKLWNYQFYYNDCRTHSGRDGANPVDSGSENIVALNDYRWKKHYRGLFQLPVAA